MKFSTQEEYGLRCLLRICKAEPKGLTITEISGMEGLSTAHVGKLLRILRMGEFIDSERGQNGGYKLSRPAEKIIIGEFLVQTVINEKVRHPRKIGRILEFGLRPCFG